MVISFFMVILLYWIIEHIFYCVKTRKPLFSNLAKRPTARVSRWWAGRENATLPEPTSSRANCLKTRRLPPPWPRCFSGDRVHAVLGNLYERKTRLPGKDKTAYLTKFYTRLNHWQLTKA
jgi:hypothetical protein